MALEILISMFRIIVQNIEKQLQYENHIANRNLYVQKYVVNRNCKHSDVHRTFSLADRRKLRGEPVREDAKVPSLMHAAMHQHMCIPRCTNADAHLCNSLSASCVDDTPGWAGGFSNFLCDT